MPLDLSDKQIRRFWGSVEMTKTCWRWNGRLDRYGYGFFSASGRGLLAHRVAYELVIGPVPTGLVLDHLCRIRACVNPAHLEPVTLQENIARGVNHESVKTECKHGHPFTDDNTYVYRGKRNCRACRRETMRRLRSDP